MGQRWRAQHLSCHRLLGGGSVAAGCTATLLGGRGLFGVLPCRTMSRPLWAPACLFLPGSLVNRPPHSPTAHFNLPPPHGASRQLLGARRLGRSNEADPLSPKFAAGEEPKARPAARGLVDRDGFCAVHSEVFRPKKAPPPPLL